MSQRNQSAGKAAKITYWIATLWLALGMVATGLVQLSKGKGGQGGLDMVTHLGYPAYLLTMLGVWKILGVVALLIPKSPPGIPRTRHSAARGAGASPFLPFFDAGGVSGDVRPLGFHVHPVKGLAGRDRKSVV